MSSRRQAEKSPVIEDGKYHSILVARVVNAIMEGGEEPAQRIVYGALRADGRKEPRGQSVGYTPARDRQRQTANRNESPSCGWRHLSGAHGADPIGKPLTFAGWSVLPTPQGRCDGGRARDGNHGPTWGREVPSASATTCTRWPRQTKLSHTSAGRERNSTNSRPDGHFAGRFRSPKTN